MGSERVGPPRFAASLALRAAGVGLLTFGAAAAVERQLWASAMVAAAGALLLALELVAKAASADRLMAGFVDAVARETDERPLARAALPRASASVTRALDRLAGARALRQQRIDHLEALLDNVAASLIVLDETGAVIDANRAARGGLGAGRGPLASLALPPEGVARLKALAPGAQEILRLSDGRAVLAQAASFLAAGRRLTLISLQSVAGELDAVELKAWRDLVQVLTHEMMNSLTPICSLSQSLAARLRTPGVAAEGLAQDVEVIGRRSAGLMRFVERYRAITELPAPELEPLRSAELVARIDRLMRPMMAERGVDYASQAPRQAFALQADPELLEQALINLLKNAMEAAQGRPGAAVRLGVRLEAGQAAFVVEDNGPGLSPHELEEAFVPFFTTKPGGSGVGLTLARQIALAHGGRLEHAARKPSGAVFRLLLPAG